MKTMFGKSIQTAVKKTKKEELEVEAPSLDEKVKTTNTPKNPANMALPKGVKSPVDYRGLYSSNEIEGELTEKVMTKKDIKKRDEIADAISTKDMEDRYGDKNVKYAIAN